MCFKEFFSSRSIALCFDEVDTCYVMAEETLDKAFLTCASLWVAILRGVALDDIQVSINCFMRTESLVTRSSCSSNTSCSLVCS